MKKQQLLSVALLAVLASAYLPQSVGLAQTIDDVTQSSSATSSDDDQSQADNDHNDIPDAKEDKNHNGIPDSEEDANKNGIPDDLDEEETESASDTTAPSEDEANSQDKASTDSSENTSISSSSIETSSSSETATEVSSQPQASDKENVSQSTNSADNTEKKDQAPKVKQAESSKQSSPSAPKNNLSQAKPSPVLPSSNLLVADQEDTLPTTPPSYTTYVEHWSGKDAYSHNLLAHRYGIKAEQLDGYLNSLGIAYDHNRLNGALILKWEKESGLDARAIIAIALAESSLGTAGVATLPGSNMFGYGAFDSNPTNAAQFSDSVAVKKMTAETIIHNKNWTFKIQDSKAKKNALGTLDTVLDGGVYYTDTSGTGKRRAKIMQDIDTWIDEHGGTPAIPEELKHLGGVSSQVVPTGYQISQPMSTDSYVASSYPWGQCTWYVYNRAQELGYHYSAYMGNGGDWQYQSGYETRHTPKVGYAVSFAPGQAGADAQYGHVAIVEDVKKDGSILISESNAMGLGVVSYRTFSPAQAQTLTYVVGKK